MALRKTLTVTAQSLLKAQSAVISSEEKTISIDAYIKVVAVGGDKHEANAEVSLSDGHTKLIENYSFSVDLDGPNFIKQAYDHLKTLDRFSGAEDV